MGTKKNMLVIFPTLIVVAMVLTVSLSNLYGQLSAQEVNEVTASEVVQAAVDGLGYFLERLPTEIIANYGFSSKEELSQATVGDPFRVYTITPDKIMSYNKKIEFSSLISPTSLWLFPVLCHGEVRTILTVDLVQGKQEAVAIGSSRLARQLALIKKKWPSSDGYEHKLVRIYQAKSDFVVLSKDGTTKIIPLYSAAVALQLGEPVEGVYGLYDPAEIISKLIPPVHQAFQLQ